MSARDRGRPQRDGRGRACRRHADRTRQRLPQLRSAASTFDYWVSVGGYEQALRTSARAGHSEHQLGTAIDVTSEGGAPPWEYADWATTPAGAWMAANAWRYGFVMSYPRGAYDVTCYDYEPWHYRYVGRDLAAEITASGRVRARCSGSSSSRLSLADAARASSWLPEPRAPSSTCVRTAWPQRAGLRGTAGRAASRDRGASAPRLWAAVRSRRASHRRSSVATRSAGGSRRWRRRSRPAALVLLCYPLHAPGRQRSWNDRTAHWPESRAPCSCSPESPIPSRSIGLLRPPSSGCPTRPSPPTPGSDTASSRVLDDALDRVASFAGEHT